MWICLLAAHIEQPQNTRWPTYVSSVRSSPTLSEACLGHTFQTWAETWAYSAPACQPQFPWLWARRRRTRPRVSASFRQFQMPPPTECTPDRKHGIAGHRWFEYTRKQRVWWTPVSFSHFDFTLQLAIVNCYSFRTINTTTHFLDINICFHWRLRRFPSQTLKHKLHTYTTELVYACSFVVYIGT